MDVRARAKPVGKWTHDILRDFPADVRYLIGVSGGRDSVALLHWLLGLGYRRLIVCHLNHQLRGQSSRADASFVERFAWATALPFELASIDVRAQAVEQKQSIETAARHARFSFFAAVARRRRCHRIFLGHHADDLVETFLINLFRGAGLRGQRSIQPVSTRLIERVELTIVRPLLGVSRAEIEAYVGTHGLRFREDASNASTEPLRNRVRHRIIPLLEREFGRDIRTAVRRAATIAADEDAFLDGMLPAGLVNATKLKAKQLRELPPSLQRRVIAKWLRARAVSDVSFEMVEQVRRLLAESRNPAKVNLTGNRHARRRAGELFIEG